jgi:hypothetical protein
MSSHRAEVTMQDGLVVTMWKYGDGFWRTAKTGERIADLKYAAQVAAMRELEGMGRLITEAAIDYWIVDVKEFPGR